MICLGMNVAQLNADFQRNWQDCSVATQINLKIVIANTEE